MIEYALTLVKGEEAVRQIDGIKGRVLSVAITWEAEEEPTEAYLLRRLIDTLEKRAKESADA